MATAITSHTIGSDLKAAPDQIFSAEALPNATNKSSSAFLFNQNVGGCEIKVVCETGVTLTAALVIEVQTAATEAGSYTTVATETVPLGAIAAGDELLKYVAPRELVDQIWTKIKLTTTADESAGKVDAYIVALTR
jgi:hypothetical protein